MAISDDLLAGSAKVILKSIDSGWKAQPPKY
jgi:hypothetical protein